MANPLLPLRFREPMVRWMLSAAVAALVLHGLAWFVAGALFFGSDDAVGEAQRQMALALAWMIGAMIIWRLSPPPSRLHAILGGLGCVLFVAGIGTAFRLLTLTMEGAVLTREVMVSFGILAGIMLLIQLGAALPSLLLLQALALTRRPLPPPPLPPLSRDHESG